MAPALASASLRARQGKGNARPDLREQERKGSGPGLRAHIKIPSSARIDVPMHTHAHCTHACRYGWNPSWTPTQCRTPGRNGC